MNRFRLSTLLLLIVISALCVALFVQKKRADQREGELKARLQAKTIIGQFPEAHSATQRETK
jgi:hypothetical protein